MSAKRNPHDYPSHIWLLARMVTSRDEFSLPFKTEGDAKDARTKFYQFRDSLIRSPVHDPQLAKGLPYVSTRIVNRGTEWFLHFSRRVPVYTRTAPGARTNTG